MRADWIKLMIAAACLPVRSEPANNQFEPKCPRSDLVFDWVIVDPLRTLSRVVPNGCEAATDKRNVSITIF